MLSLAPCGLTVRRYVLLPILRRLALHCAEGCSEWAEPILTAGGRAVGEYTEVFVGIDVAKTRNAIAIGEGGPGALFR
jgi:hypothetical protein